VAARTERLALDRPRDLGELIGLTLALFARHFSVFYTLALIVVTPYVLLVDGVWGRALSDGSSANVPLAGGVSALVGSLIAQPLITAMHVRVVMELGEGRLPTVNEALRAGLQVFPAAAFAVLLFTLGVSLGVICLVIPGIWLGVRWYFAAQAVVVDGRHGPGALARSAEIVKGQWWTTAGRILLIALLAAILGGIISQVLRGIADSANSPALYVIGLILGQAAAASIGALGGTLLFFDRRARKDVPWREAGEEPLPDAPERPVEGGS
jgi:hypothetical protein